MAKSAFYAASRDWLKKPRVVAIVSSGSSQPVLARLSGVTRVSVVKKDMAPDPVTGRLRPFIK